MPRFLIGFCLLAGLMCSPAMAYVGPGSGLGIIGVVFGIIGTVVLSLVSLVWYPIKRAHRRIRAALARDGQTTGGQDGGRAGRQPKR